MPLTIVFACNSNSCRSQMAEAHAKTWLQNSQDSFQCKDTMVCSVALDTAAIFKSCKACCGDRCTTYQERKAVKEKAIEALAKDGIDISTYKPKTLPEILPYLELGDSPGAKPIDWLIVLCSCGDETRAKLMRKSKSFRSWNVEAPTAAAKTEGESAYRRVSHDIRDRVASLMEELHLERI